MAPKFIMATFFGLNLAFFAFVPTKAATCPALNVCASMAGSLNIPFGSQSSSQCCTLLNGIGSATDAATCLCSTIKALISSSSTPPVLGGAVGGIPLLGGVLGGLPILGGVLGTVGGLVTPILAPVIDVISGAPVVGGVVSPILGPVIGRGSASASTTTTLSQPFSAIINGCGLASPPAFTCA